MGIQWNLHLNVYLTEIYFDVLCQVGNKITIDIQEIQIQIQINLIKENVCTVVKYSQYWILK